MANPSEVARASGRDFLKTHPWITFRLDISRVDSKFWMLLGESRSKCRHLSLTPLPPALAAELKSVYLAKGAHATTAIEGNTLTEEQARLAVDGKLKLPSSQRYLQVEVENVIKALNGLEVDIRRDGGAFNLSIDRMRAFNLQILEGTEFDEGVVPGQVRDYSVVVANYKAPRGDDAEFLLGLLSDWLNGPDFQPVDGDSRATYLRAICRAIAAHVYLAWIHPFGDGNGRTARLLEFGVLTAAGLPDVAAHLLSNHYNLTRSEYYRQLERSSADETLTAFLGYAVEGLVDQLQGALDMVHASNVAAAFENYVHQLFREHVTVAGKRQRDLVLALAVQGGWVRRVHLTGITPPLAASYAGKQAKTLTRDLNRLTEMGLIERGPAGIRARTELMLQFLPPVTTDGPLD